MDIFKWIYSGFNQGESIKKNLILKKNKIFTGIGFWYGKKYMYTVYFL